MVLLSEEALDELRAFLRGLLKMDENIIEQIIDKVEDM